LVKFLITVISALPRRPLNGSELSTPEALIGQLEW
jgi:hypothetical protein